MRRRGFIKSISQASLAPLLLNGVPVNALAQFGKLQEVAAQSTNDRVLVLIQLHGGNDGLNTLVPLNQYDRYHQLRSNIALPTRGSRKCITLDGSLPEAQQIGLHPDILALKQLYDQGRAAMVQSVAYQNMNGSHFRSRDVWFMGGDDNDRLGSGWAGRYLDSTYPGYPDSYPSSQMPDPIALEIGARVSLAFHRDNGIPIALAVDNPEQLRRLVAGEWALPTGVDTGSYYGKALNYVMNVENKSNQYAKRLDEVYQRGRNQVVYPERYHENAPGQAARNRLSPQLKTIARLLSGGCRTKVFLARINGFDTHGRQVAKGDTTRGAHAALLHNLFASIQAFQNDLSRLGLEDRVMTVTFSEFGRRAASNAGFGTDHGNAAPMFVFGKRVQPGVVGQNPNLNQLDKGNLSQQYDYRQVFATLLDDWMGASPQAIAAARFTSFARDSQKLPLVAQGGGTPSPSPSPNPDPSPAPEPAPTTPPPASPGSPPPLFNPPEPYYLFDAFPNPVVDHVTLRFKVSGKMPYRVTVTDKMGTTVQTFSGTTRATNIFTREVNLSGLKPGIYSYTLEVQAFRKTKQFVKQ